MIISKLTAATLFGALGALVVVSATTADAGYRRAPENLSAGYVVAESQYGNGSVSGPVRMTGLGPQVRSPGGNWYYCRQSCSETLRVETIDFWEAQTNYGSTAAAECGGIFGCLRIERGW